MRKFNSQKTEAPFKNKAVALHYDVNNESAPKVIAKGEGTVADAIRKRALHYGIPIRQDNDLVELLSQVDLDKEIPGELFAAVAEVLSWIYRANEGLKKNMVHS